MNNSSYEKNENRIVRVKNDTMHETFELISHDLNVHYQWVFEIWCEFVVQFGHSPSFSFFYNHCKAVKLLQG